MVSWLNFTVRGLLTLDHYLQNVSSGFIKLKSCIGCILYVTCLFVVSLIHYFLHMPVGDHTASLVQHIPGFIKKVSLFKSKSVSYVCPRIAPTSLSASLKCNLLRYATFSFSVTDHYAPVECLTWSACSRKLKTWYQEVAWSVCLNV